MKRWIQRGAFGLCLTAVGSYGDLELDPPQDRLDRTHAAMERRVLAAMDRIDNFFGDEQIGESSHYQDKLKLKFGVVLSERGKLEFKFSADIKLAVPHLRHKVRLIVDSIGFEETQPEETTQPAPAGEDNQIFTGLRYEVKQTKKFRSDVDAGIKIRHMELTPFARLMFKRSEQWDHWALGLRQSFFWFQDDGFGEESRMDWTREVKEDLFFRTTSKFVWSESSEGVVFDEGLTVYSTRRGTKRMAGIKGGASSHVEPGAEIDAYRASLFYRKQMKKKYLYVLVEPGASFPRERDFDFTPSLLVGLEIVFEEKNGLVP